MTESAEPRRLDLSATIERGALQSATVIHRSTDNPTIDSIALVTRAEEARRVGPRAAVVIADAAANSGWLASSVVRFAWERRASVVVAAGQQPDSVGALARRLDINLLSVENDSTGLALQLAADIGAANAAVEAQLVSLLHSVGRAPTVDAILRVASRELSDMPLELVYRDRPIAVSGQPIADEPSALIALHVAGPAGDAVELRAQPRPGPAERTFTRTALELVIPYLRAAWFTQATSDHSDGIAIVAAAGEESARITGGRALLSQVGWKDGEFHFVVYLRPPEAPSPTLSDLVRLLWQRAMGRLALTRLHDGWVAVLEADDEDGLTDAVELLREHAAPGLADLGIGVGVSSLEADSSRLHDLVIQARAAARASQASHRPEVGEFDKLGLSAIDHLIDYADARSIGALVVPEFCAAPDRETLAESVAAFLAGGSVTAAADALGIHRNTLTMRLDRARALGLPVGDAASTLAILALMRALNSEAALIGDIASTRPPNHNEGATP